MLGASSKTNANSHIFQVAEKSMKKKKIPKEDIVQKYPSCRETEMSAVSDLSSGTMKERRGHSEIFKMWREIKRKAHL